MQHKHEINLLYVDDEPVNLQGFKANFRRDYNVFLAGSAAEARETLSKHDIHILITDQKMPETLGTDLLEQVVKDYPHQERIMITAYSDSQVILDAFQKGHIYRYVLKPYNPDELKQIIDQAYKLFSLKRIQEMLYADWKKNNDGLNKPGGGK
jgi:response regulator RpfG family c-di-GMP phosphodiesterase